jgi:DNA repair protein RadC
MKSENAIPIDNICEIELIYRSKIKPSERPKIVTSKDAYDIVIATWDQDKIELIEQFKILLLNRGNKVLGRLSISSGGITGTIADPRIIMAAVIKSAACALILCHNHPSGNLLPSKADEELTQKIKQACKFFDVSVIDHLVITKEGYYSFADGGIL